MGPLLPLGMDPSHTSPDLGMPSSTCCEQAAAPRTSLDQSQALHWGHGSALGTLLEKESLNSRGLVLLRLDQTIPQRADLSKTSTGQELQKQNATSKG